MDPKDIKPGRPSLLSAADSGTASAASGPRILADMETGSGRKARTGLRKPRPLLLLLGVCTIAMLAGYYFLAASGWELPDEPAVAAAEPSTPATESLRSGAVATIDTAADAESLPGPFDSLSARSDDPAEFPLSDLLDEPSKAAAAGTPLIAAHTASRAAQATPRKRARGDGKKRAANRSEAPLMASLLKNIEQDKITASAARSLPQPAPAPAPPAAPVPAAVTPATPAPASARDHDAMDALVQQVSKGNTVASGGRTQTVQEAVRKCPPANTRAGLRCRERICTKFRGDKACPN